jgi:hypothetical protein
MATITINGVTFTGNSVSIVNGRVTVDGAAGDGTVSGVVEVKLDGLNVAPNIVALHGASGDHASPNLATGHRRIGA